MYKLSRLILMVIWLDNGIIANEFPCQSPVGPLGTCYWIASHTVPNQQEAIIQCAEFGGKLASVTSVKVQEFLKIHINFSPISPYAWIGLNDIVTESVFKWIDGSPATWFDWADLNPQGRPGEDCGVVDRNWQFTDSFCTGTKFFDPAICEGIPGFSSNASSVPSITTQVDGITTPMDDVTTQVDGVTTLLENITTSSNSVYNEFSDSTPNDSDITTNVIDIATQKYNKASTFNDITTSTYNMTSRPDDTVTTSPIDTDSTATLSSTVDETSQTIDATLNSSMTSSPEVATRISQKRDKCAHIPTWLGVAYNLYHRPTFKYIYYHCTAPYVPSTGFRHSRPSMAVCSRDYGWWPPIANCIPLVFHAAAQLTDAKMERPVEAKHAEVFGSFALILVVCEMLFILVIDLRTYNTSLTEAYRTLSALKQRTMARLC